jgi:DNA-binding winged helix-turn-helix (wHTH) protein
MTPSEKRILEFGPFQLDATERVLLRDGQSVPLTLKAFDVLLLLVENTGHIVRRTN